MIKHDTSAGKDEFYRIQVGKFAIQTEETIETQRNLFCQESAEELRRNEDASGRSILEDRLQN